ncbi:hypothetical protein P154DRAFT_30963 [Amniculicola lignicola CBS 123094]|uniref:Uncharacterized protein n=1 Tax=Amniculicola lignicola CBS 123094 TaxID=1392246 RepID=A0A6A5W2K3_9PLEO|nr:hypothetical protein P154DRAFT_30963 [Amniculicola lignicola CBS 123094]
MRRVSKIVVDLHITLLFLILSFNLSPFSVLVSRLDPRSFCADDKMLRPALSIAIGLTISLALPLTYAIPTLEATTALPSLSGNYPDAYSPQTMLYLLHSVKQNTVMNLRPLPKLTGLSPHFYKKNGKEWGILTARGNTGMSITTEPIESPKPTDIPISSTETTSSSSSEQASKTAPTRTTTGPQSDHPIPTRVLDDSMVPSRWRPHINTFIGTRWFAATLMLGILAGAIAVVWWISLCQCCWAGNCFWNLWDEDCWGGVGRYRQRRNTKRRAKMRQYRNQRNTV